MKYLINLAVVALIGLLGFLLYSGINEPIKFRAELSKREDVVKTRLTNIRSLQEIYRDIKGKYAPNFDELLFTLKNDSIPLVKLEPDPADPQNPDKYTRLVTYSLAKDAVAELGFDLDQVRYVPFTDRKVQFEMQADTASYQQIVVPVMECMTRYETFMGEFSNPAFSKYAKSYDPKKKLGFGSMTSPNLEGNWK